MAMGLGQGTEMSQPMAVVVVGGMVYGTLLTLIAVPCLYDAMNRDKDMTEEDLDDEPELAAVTPEGVTVAIGGADSSEVISDNVELTEAADSKIETVEIENEMNKNE
jgi:HAE1 family hydrophobic/amphiphilic exporter-1